jgi:hypothetical protein
LIYYSPAKMNQYSKLNINIMGRNAAGYWKDKKEKLLKRYNNLTEKDLQFNLGQEKEMIETLCNKLGKTNQELLSIIVTI